jgi:histidinol-phosphate aminotransferase
VSFQEHLRAGIAELPAFRLFDYGPAGADLARLDCNELPFPPDPVFLDDFQRALAKLALNRYPDVTGEPLRRSLGAQWNVDPTQILLGNGSIEVLALLMTALGGGRSGRPATVLYPDPSFPHYEVIARTNGVRPLSVPLTANFALDEPALEAAIDEHRPALAIVASPNNPTGNAFEPALLERLARRMDAAFVVDEAYIDFADGGASARSMIRRIPTTPGLFVTRTFSKIGFAGLRVGALIGPRAAIAELDKVRLPWNLSAPALAFATAIMARPERLEARVRAVVELRRAFEADLRTVPGLCVYSSEANFLLIRAPRPAALVRERLLERGILVKDVSRPGLLERCLRVTVGSTESKERCARALREALR